LRNVLRRGRLRKDDEFVHKSTEKEMVNESLLGKGEEKKKSSKQNATEKVSSKDRGVRNLQRNPNKKKKFLQNP